MLKYLTCMVQNLLLRVSQYLKPVTKVIRKAISDDCNGLTTQNHSIRVILEVYM